MESMYRFNYVDVKGDETEVVLGFLERLGLTPQKVTERERPDFYITLYDDHCLGLELTNLYADTEVSRGSIERRTHSLWQKVAFGIRERLYEAPHPLPNVYGAISFYKSSTFALDKIDIDEFCDEILLLLLRSSLSPEKTQLTTFPRSQTPLLSDFVQQITIRVLSPEEHPLWGCSDLQSGQVEDPKPAIRSIVAEKCHKASSYKWNGLTDRWLLIFAPGNGLNDLAVGLENPDLRGVTHYTTVFLWDKFSETIYLLHPEFMTVFEMANSKDEKFHESALSNILPHIYYPK